MQHTRLTRRGWAAVTLAGVLMGAGLGAWSAAGEDPCSHAITTLECQP